MLSAVNEPLLEQLAQQQVEVELVPVKLGDNTTALEGELDAPVEFCAKQEEPAMVVARNRAYNWKSAGICFRFSHRQCFCRT